MLRRRPVDGAADAAVHEALELRVNGVFVMDTEQTTTERALARSALRDLVEARDVLIGGLGLGFTAQEVLRDSRVQHVTVVEIEQAVASWLRDGTVPHGPALFDDPRLLVTVADLRDFLAAVPPAEYDLILLDVDNGPDSLVFETNAALYEHRFLSLTQAALRPGGRLVIWSAAPSRRLAGRLRTVFGNVAERSYEVDLQGRGEHYWMYHSDRSTHTATTGPFRSMFGP